MTLFGMTLFLTLFLTLFTYGVSMSEQTESKQAKSEQTEQNQAAQERTPDDLGVVDGKLAPCPESPNCVSTQAPEDDHEHYIAPVPFENTPGNTMNRIVQEVTRMPRTRITQKSDTYLRAEFRSRIFRFVDDVEFYLDTETNLIHLRSAARKGYGDFGANRERMETLANYLRP